MNQPFTLPSAIQTLPIADVAEQVYSALQRGNVLLSAEPGAGKSTGLPLALLDAAAPDNRIVMLEPRRLAAIGVAERLASMLNEPLGETVGLRMRGQTSVSKKTVLEVVTEGVLTRMLQADPTLEGIGLVIFDEFHERSMHADLGLALCLDVQQSIRENLRLLLMSATLEMDDISTALGDVEKISCAGRQYPVDVHWVGSSPARQSSQSTSSRFAQAQRHNVWVAKAVVESLQKDDGDILVFLPGIAEIARVADFLKTQVNDDTVSVLQLHGRADAKHQRQATAPAKHGHRRIILSTSIAETSITIDGVRVVVDAGLERRARVNSHTGSQQLETVSASQASATQRAGRAGRTSSGVCYRLWSEHDHVRRTKTWQPEILRTELSTLVVEMGLWGANTRDSLPWLEPPPQSSIDTAVQLLSSLNMWHEGRLSAHGKACAKLPVHPRLAHMLVWSLSYGAEELACTIAVVLEEGAVRQSGCDLEIALKQKLNRQQQQRVSQLLKLLRSSSKSLDTSIKNGNPSVGVVLAQAYPDWIAQRRAGRDARFALASGAGVQMFADDALAHQPWVSIANMGGSSSEARIFLASDLNIEELRECSPEQFALQKHVAWDDALGRVIAEQRECVGKLVVSSAVITNLSDDEVSVGMLQGIRKRGLDCLPWTDDCRQWQARVQFVSGLLCGEALGPWPIVDDATLLDEIDEWLSVWLNGVRSMKALSQLKLYDILQSMLNYQQQQALSTLLPVRYTVPSGSNIRLHYEHNEPPVLSVKLQEMFGCQVNPAIAKGEVVLKVELLSPARRPVQVTADLENFWTSSYASVKKDMAGRYPKHDWPDDPLSAKPTAYAKRRK